MENALHYISVGRPAVNRAGVGAVTRRYRNARFLISAPDRSGAPADVGREVAFAGRSNAGKSSVLNALAGRRGLARVSRSPGRTQLLNFFEAGPARRLVDLPGYGYAKVPRALKARWERSVTDYLERRRSLCGIILVMDIRHPLGAGDENLLRWCAAASLPVHALLTKADKLSRNRVNITCMQVLREMNGRGPEVGVQAFSSPQGTGVDELEAVLDRWLGDADA